MLVHKNPDIHLTYCLNAHPAETLQDVLGVLNGPVLAIKNRIAPDRPFGLGLHLTCKAAQALSAPQKTDRFEEILNELGFYLFTLNGFPYGSFHGEGIKENVYKPDWREPDRRDYTCLLAQILSATMPENSYGSISTVPCSYRTWIKSQSDIRFMVHLLTEVVNYLADLRETSGQFITVALEPEPGCFLETTDGMISFMKQHVLREGLNVLRGKRNCTPAQAEQLLRDHLGVCLDTCHCAVISELPAKALARYQEEGIRVAKVQLSAALAVQPSHFDRLKELAEPSYLHQVRAVGGTHARGWNDLPEALPELKEDPNCDELLVHFHMPLYWEGEAGFRSTRDVLSDMFFQRLLAGNTPHLEIETYTYDILPDDITRATIEDGVVAEYEWVLAELKRAGA